MVAWLSVVSVIETGVEKVDSGVSVTGLVNVPCGLPEVPRPVENSVTEAGGDGATGDRLFDTVTEVLLDTAGVTGETTLDDVGTPEAVGEGREDVVVEAGAETGAEVTSTSDELGEIGCGGDVVDTTEELVVSDMSNAALGEEPVRLAEGVGVRSWAPNAVELNKTVVAFVAFVWSNEADGSNAFVRDTPGGDEVELVELVPLTLTT